MLEKSLPGLFFLVLCSNAPAVEWSTGLDLGGDTLTSLPLVGGDTADIRAGDGLYFKIGTAMPLTDDGATEFVGMIGIKYWGVRVTTSGGSEGEERYTRYPLDLSVRHTIENHRFSAGVTKDLSVDFSCSGVLACYNTSMESQLGYSLQYEYKFTRLTLGVRYTSIKYDLTDLDVTVDGSSTGIILGGSF